MTAHLPRTGRSASIADGFLELLYPARCVLCDAPGSVLCPACEAWLVPIDRETACPRCGAPDGVRQCVACQGVTFAFSAARAVGSLDDDHSRIVTVYKDSLERRLAAPIARLMAVAAGEDWRSWADCVAFVPDGADAWRRRGFDHMEEVARPFAALCHVPLVDVLVHGRAPDQRSLSREQRAASARGVFSPAPGGGVGDVAGRRVLLVDDVFTTGATASAAAETLLALGAADVRLVVFARVW